jgi:hypothetical protein
MRTEKGILITVDLLMKVASFTIENSQKIYLVKSRDVAESKNILKEVKGA